MNIVMLSEKSEHLITGCSNEGLPRDHLGAAGAEASGAQGTGLQRAGSDKKEVTTSVGFWCELNS